MSDISTIARPYAKAAFSCALSQNALTVWAHALSRFACGVVDPVVQAFITNPEVTVEQKCQLVLAVLSHAPQANEYAVIKNFIYVLAENKRLLALPEIYAQFEALREEQEKTLTVHLVSFSAPDKAQQEQLISSLSKRLKRQVSLEINIDKSILGGALIQAGDFVIDGTIRGKLNKLGIDLAA